MQPFVLCTPCFLVVVVERSKESLMHLIWQHCSSFGTLAGHCQHGLSLTEEKDKTGEGSANKMIQSEIERDLKMDKLCFQSYDYSASTSGKFNKVEQKLPKECCEERYTIP